MDETLSSSAYREKAAELRAAADKVFDFSIRYELLTTAERYDRLAEVAEKQGR